MYPSGIIFKVKNCDPKTIFNMNPFTILKDAWFNFVFSFNNQLLISLSDTLSKSVLETFTKGPFVYSLAYFRLKAIKGTSVVNSNVLNNFSIRIFD